MSSIIFGVSVDGWLLVGTQCIHSRFPIHFFLHVILVGNSVQYTLPIILKIYSCI